MSTTCYCVNHDEVLKFQKCVNKSFIKHKPVPCMGFQYFDYVIIKYRDEVYSWEPKRRKDFVLIERFLKISIEEGMQI
jgi:hypothetical protein